MNVNCSDFDRILERGDAQEMAALESHASTCEACRRQLALDREISAAAPLLQKSWPSPDLWPRIHQSLAEESQRAPRRRGFAAWFPQWQMAAAALALIVVTATATWMLTKNGQQPGNLGAGTTTTTPDAEQRLLTEKAFSDVELKEAEYIKSIDRLAELAQPKLAKADSPLLLSYREKLLVLDSAIAELRTQAEQNQFNAHLRNELLEIYQMKQHTLQEVLRQ